MRKKTYDFKSFCGGVKVEKKTVNEFMIRMAVKHRTLIKVGGFTVAILSSFILDSTSVQAATDVVKTHIAAGSSWQHLIDSLLSLLDPIAKIFGMIAGVAIMTGNGKIGLERLFWLSIGYITARKVDIWIDFLRGL